MLFHSVVDRGVGKRRQNALPSESWSRYPLSFMLEGFQCVRHDEHISYGNVGDSVPPFGLAFCSGGNLQNVLAAANEEGIVRIYNTESRKQPLIKEWLAHENAVFDIAWVPGEPQLVTAAGDQMARLWDVTSAEMLGSFKGHLCSLKSVAFAPQEKAVFCTGARDGNIMVWDIRCSKKDGFYRQVNQISGAHNKAETSAPTKTKKRRSNMRGMAPSVDSQQSVTVVLFRDEHTLISSGAVDGVIKMWDLRRNFTSFRPDPVPLQSYPYPGSCMRMRLGYSGLVLDSSRSNVMCNCTDDSIYMFNVCGVNTSPAAVFSGHQNSSFYVKSTISPDDQFLASGSSDNHTYIWKISDHHRPPMTLQGHSEEVTSVVWCPTDFTKIASCSDDHTIRIWRMNRELEKGVSSVGQTNMVGWSHRTSTLGPSLKVETTPAKNLKPESLGGLASPQLAVCAPNRAAMPLSSSTSSPVHSQKATKKPAVRQRTPTSSIKQWLSPRQGTTAQSSTSSATPERKVKRRLETGDSSSPVCEDEERCQCVSELNPVAKRCRHLSSTEDSSNHSTPTDTEKENCSPPTTANWLSAMSQKIRIGQRSPRREASITKKQDVRTQTAPSVQSQQSMKKISMYFPKKPLE